MYRPTVMQLFMKYFVKLIEPDMIPYIVVHIILCWWNYWTFRLIFYINPNKKFKVFERFEIKLTKHIHIFATTFVYDILWFTL